MGVLKELDKNVFEWQIKEEVNMGRNSQINTWTSQVYWSHENTLPNGEKECQG